MHILTTNGDVRSLHRVHGSGKTNKRRADGNLVAAVIGHQRQKIAKESLRLLRSLVHLPIRCHQFLARHSVLSKLRTVNREPRTEDHTYLLVKASTPGSFLPSRNSSEAPPPVEI